MEAESPQVNKHVCCCESHADLQLTAGQVLVKSDGGALQNAQK